MKNRLMRNLIIALAAGVLLVPLAGCEQEKEGPMEKMGESLDEAVDDAKDAIEDAGDGLEEAADEMGDEIEEGAEEVEDAVEGDGAS